MLDVNIVSTQNVYIANIGRYDRRKFSHKDMIAILKYMQQNGGKFMIIYFFENNFLAQLFNLEYYDTFSDFLESIGMEVRNHDDFVNNYY